MSQGVEYDKDVWNALEWLASLYDDKKFFYKRLAEAQCNYIKATSMVTNFCKPFDSSWYGLDIVAGFFSQAKSLLDNRRAYEFHSASLVIPWVKKLGECTTLLDRISGAKERAKRMLENEKIVPDSALLELILAGNYAELGYEVEFIPEKKGIAKTPDFKCSIEGEAIFFVECKRLQKGSYAKQEEFEHRQRIRTVESYINARKMNIWFDVTYYYEVKNIPEEYLIRHLNNFENDFYEWQDEYGRGFIKSADLNKIRKDIEEKGSLLFSVKLARLIKGAPLENEGYDVFSSGLPDERDSRYISYIINASLVTWRCNSEKSREAKSRHVTKTLSEIDKQLLGFGLGVGHIVLDADVERDIADRRRAKNNNSTQNFFCQSYIARTNIHYLVPRRDENSSWMIDETVDEYYANTFVRELIPVARIFPAAIVFDNDLPGWHQK